MTPLITVVLPVFGRPLFLSSAINSVLNQDDPDWELLIADDGSDSETYSLLQSYTFDRRIKLIRRQYIVGLFSNLNKTITEVSSPWQLILCSDDLLLPNAITRLKQLTRTYRDCNLILSSFLSIGSSGEPKPDVNGLFYDRFSPETRVFSVNTLLPHLLHYGSVNGNITGMLIHRSLFIDAGNWRGSWSQSADWEWLIRATSAGSILVNRDPIAYVRIHPQQLSVSNGRNTTEIHETSVVLHTLLLHPYLANLPQRYEWAAHHSQFLLWNIFKHWRHTGFKESLHSIIRIHMTVGIMRTLRALITSMPGRIRNYKTGLPLLPR